MNEIPAGFKVFLTTIGLIVVIALIFLFTPFTTVSAGYRGVVLRWGAFEGKVLSEGLHWRTPISTKIVKMEVRVKPIEIKASQAYSADQQTVTVHSVANYFVNPNDVGSVYQQYGLDFETSILRPKLEEIVKNTFAKYTAEQIIHNRGEISGEIKTAFSAAIPSFFTATNYSYVNEDFSDAYEKSVERKVIALQDAEAAKNHLTQATLDAQASIEQAKGEAEKIRIQAQAVTQQGGHDYVELQKIMRWDGRGCTQYCGLETSNGLLVTPK